MFVTFSFQLSSFWEYCSAPFFSSAHSPLLQIVGG